ncbi:N-acetyllactosaminide beta-1,3-N-acetylglucosaminyltransferase 3 [Pelodytes ibericus]
MRRSLLRMESLILTCIGLVGIIFILQKSVNDPSGSERVHQSEDIAIHPTARLSEIPQMQWESKCQINTSVLNVSGFSTLPAQIKDFLSYKHCRSFTQIRNSPLKCGGPAASKNIFILLAIKSSPVNYDRRAIIRQTWGVEQSYAGAEVRRIFLSGTVGKEKENKRMKKLLHIESQTYGDILQWDFIDTLFNLTLKQVLFHRWLEDYCPGAQFIFNGDDDVFVNTFNVVAYLRGQGPHGAGNHLFVGQLIANVGPIRESWSKYYVPVQVTISTRYPIYCGGGGILMSRFTAHSIYNMSVGIPLFPIDDVYLGMCLEKAGLVPTSHIGMRTVGVHVPSANLDSFNPCYYRELLMVHRFVPYEMLIMWKAIQEPDLNCGQKRGIYIGI